MKKFFLYTFILLVAFLLFATLVPVIPYHPKDFRLEGEQLFAYKISGGIAGYTDTMIIDAKGNITGNSDGVQQLTANQLLRLGDIIEEGDFKTKSFSLTLAQRWFDPTYFSGADSMYESCFIQKDGKTLVASGHALSEYKSLFEYFPGGLSI